MDIVKETTYILYFIIYNTLYFEDIMIDFKYPLENIMKDS